MNKIFIVMGLVISVMNLRALAFQDPRVRVTIEVVDEDGQPVPNAKVQLGFPGVGPQDLPPEDRCFSDAEGMFSVTARSIGLISGYVVKDGFYGTGFRFDRAGHVPRGITVGRRWPDVRYRVMIRRIVNPVPMYAYRFHSRFPAEGEEIGFDFLKADWVAPHGKGETSDVLVRIVTNNPESNAGGGEYSLRFPNEGDGMVRVDMDRFYEETELRGLNARAPEEGHQESDFRMPYREAPENGYIAEWQGREGERWILISMEPEGPRLSEVPYYIRIRTELDDDGNVLRAIYGKIFTRGGQGIVFRFAVPRRIATIVINYYINPDGTRNTEFDPERNLFEGVLPRRNFPKEP